MGNYFNIADVCVISCLKYIDLRFSKFNWRSEYLNLTKYWRFHKDRKSFQEIKPVVQTIEPLKN